MSIHGLVKQFGDVVAVNGLELEVPARVCYGLLGPNGAGKSTTMRILTGQAIADAGQSSVLGLACRPSQSSRERGWGSARRRATSTSIWACATCSRCSLACIACRPQSGRPRSTGRWRSPGLQQRARDSAVKLSGGMQRRLLIARALIHQPELVLLDEPTVGLDPQVRQELWSLIVALREQGATVLMSTHYIEEAERLADRVAIMSAGRVVAEGTPAELILAASPAARSSTCTASAAQLRDTPARARTPTGCPRGHRVLR